jgi:predicted ATPase
MLASRAAGPVDQGAVACVRIDLYMTTNRSDFAIDVALSYLRDLGGEWTPHPTDEAVRQEYDRTWSLLGAREIEELIDVPLMSAPASVAAMEVLDKALPPLPERVSETIRRGFVSASSVMTWSSAAG